MTGRELAAYLLLAVMAFAVLVGWRVAAWRRRGERRSGYAQMDLVGGGAFAGKAPSDDGAASEQQADTDPAEARLRSED